MVKNGVDATSVEGAANLPYAVPNVSVELTTTKVGLPVLWWRVVGSSHTAYAVEAFIDEAAHTAGKDPYAFRRDLLAKERACARCWTLLAQKAGWDPSKPLPKGRGRGIAVAEAFKSYVAQVAEVSVDADGKVKVERVVCAVDCGIAINPDIVAAQMEGGIGFGRRGDAQRDHAEGRPGRAAQLRRLPRAADGRDAEGRGAYRAVGRSADRGRRAGRRADRAGGRERDLRGDGQAALRAAVRFGG